VQRGHVTVLRILNKEDHEEGNDGCAGIDYELPSIRVSEYRSGGCPDDDGHASNDEGGRLGRIGERPTALWRKTSNRCDGLSWRNRRSAGGFRPFSLQIIVSEDNKCPAIIAEKRWLAFTDAA
jgi:hypothetical protein